MIIIKIILLRKKLIFFTNVNVVCKFEDYYFRGNYFGKIQTFSAKYSANCTYYIVIIIDE